MQTLRYWDYYGLTDIFTGLHDRSKNQETVWHVNTVVMGIQNYYSHVTNISKNLSELTYRLNKTLYNRLKCLRTEAEFSDMTKSLQKRYRGYKSQYYKIKEMVFVPIYAQRHKSSLCFSQETCNYTSKGREKIHNSLKAINRNVLSYVMKNFILGRTIEYNDNRISKFIAQYGKCAILGTELGKNDWHCHHITPYHLSKDHRFSNLIVLHEAVHRLVHIKDEHKIKDLLNVLNLNEKQIQKLNELREQCKNDLISA